MKISELSKENGVHFRLNQFNIEYIELCVVVTFSPPSEHLNYESKFSNK